MPYDRIYTLSEVSRILYESELRPRPATGMPGHALGQHGDLRDDITDKRFKPVILLAATLEETRAMRPEDGVGTPIAPHKLEPKDGKFLSRKDVIKAVHEALNSPGGQQELRKLNGTANSVKIAVKLVLNQGKLRAAVCQHPTINTGTKKKPNLVFVTGPTFYQEGFVDRIVLIVDKLPDPNAGCEIHIQTVWHTL
jgi:hypothetical protein